MTDKIYRVNKDPMWYKDAVIYELHVKAFLDSNGDGIGDFKGLISRLDYLANLGVTAIWLLPFYPSPMKDDGYDIAEYFNVNQVYGSLKDFKEFLNQAHKRNLSVITELVLNHTSDQHPWFQKARISPPGSPARDFYVWSDNPEKYEDARIIFKDFETSNWSWDPVARAYYWHRFYSYQPDLNYDNPAVQKAMIKVIDFWLNMGVDGLRLDAVPYLFEREGTNCENLPETHQFIKKIRNHIDRKFFDRILLAEANQWSEDAMEYFGEKEGDECHMAFNFPIMPRMFMSIQLEERFPLVNILDDMENLPESAQWALFLRNHDELTLEMVTDEERDSMYRFFAADPKARINLGIRKRLAPLLWNNPRKIEVMNVLLFSLPGTPIIYYGDEIGMGDNYYLGDRDGVRTPMQWNPYKNAGFSSANPQQLYLPVIIDPEYHYESVNVENQERNLSSRLWWMKRIIAMKKRYKTFGRGTMKMLSPSNTKVLVFIREYKEEKILVLINLSRFSQVSEVDLADYEGYVLEEVFSRNIFPRIEARPYIFTLGPYAYFWFSICREKGDYVMEERKSIPRLAGVNSLSDLFTDNYKEMLESHILPMYLKKARWFASKGRIIREAAIKEYLPLDKIDPVNSLLIIELKYVENLNEKYFLALSYAQGEKAEKIKQKYPESVIAFLSGEQNGILYDGICDSKLNTILFETVQKNRKIKSKTCIIFGKKHPLLNKIFGKAQDTPESTPLDLDQSNNSLLFGNAVIMKLFRKMESGENPDAEIIKSLHQCTRFKNSPRYMGEIKCRDSKGEEYQLAFLSGYIENENDGWHYALENAGKYFERVLSKSNEIRNKLLSLPGIDITNKKEITAETVRIFMEKNAQYFKQLTGEFFSNNISQLGVRTGELHMALASIPAVKEFIPEPFSLLYQKSVFQSMKNLTNQSFRLLEKNINTMEKELREIATEVAGMKTRIINRMKRITIKKFKAVKIRTHGDYHLGQVLFTGNDFIIIDFEGEPIRPLGERRLKKSPLRDIAGMIRSFHYAAYATLNKHPAIRPEDRKYLKPWAEVWSDYMRKQFLDSYLLTVKESVLAPPKEDEFHLLLDAYILEKAVYEVGYEVNNRPGWISIPVNGIKKILETESGGS